MTGDFEFKGRVPFRKYACPECKVMFAAVNTRGGKTCPAGHWHSLYHLNYFEKHGRLPEPRVKKEKQPKAAPPRRSPATVMRGLGIERTGDQCAVALQWWIAKYELLLNQLPPGTSRQLVTGAFGQIHGVSRELVR